MIKVNLLNSLGFGRAPNLFGAESGVESDSRQRALGRSAVILAFPLLLYGFEKFNLSSIVDEVEALNAKIAAVEQEKANFGDVAPKVEQFNKEWKKIEGQLNAVRALADRRLNEVKALDQLQSLTPARAWLSQIEISDNTVSLEGYSLEKEGVVEFMTALENSIFFSSVEPLGTEEVRLPVGTAQKFNLKFRFGGERQEKPEPEARSDSSRDGGLS